MTARLDVFADASHRTKFGSLSDLRVERAKRHDRLDVMSIALGAVLCGADS